MKLREIMNIDTRRILSFIFILLMLASSTLMAFIEREAAASICILSFSLALSFLNLDKFSKIKGAGFEAELKDAVKANNIEIAQLKKVLITIAEPTISLLAVRNQIEYLPLKYKLVHAKKISETLKSLSASDTETKDVLATLYDSVEKSHKRNILVKLNNGLSTGNKIFQSFEEVTLDEWTISRIEELAKANSIPIDNEIDDYNYFLKNRELRKPDEWGG